jgi:hypothetical protein
MMFFVWETSAHLFKQLSIKQPLRFESLCTIILDLVRNVYITSVGMNKHLKVQASRLRALPTEEPSSEQI